MEMISEYEKKGQLEAKQAEQITGSEATQDSNTQHTELKNI